MCRQYIIDGMIMVSRRPTIFRTAANFHHECGAYQLRTVVNAFGRDALPHELYWSDWMRRHDWSLPWLMPVILRRYGIRAHWYFWSANSFKKRVFRALGGDQPVLFVIRSIINPGGGLHWISAWGYDEATDEFLCYASKAPEAADTIGNTRYHADLLTSALPWWGTYALTMRHSNESRSGPGTRRAFPVHYVPFLARNGAILGVTRA